MSMKAKNDFMVNGELASIGSRVLALAIDGIILSFVTGLLFGRVHHAAWGISFVMTLAYNWFFWTRWDGQTPGKRVMGLRAVRSDGRRMSDGDALVRAIGYYVNSAIMGLGWIWALFDGQQRGLHDILAGTIVVKA